MESIKPNENLDIHMDEPVNTTGDNASQFKGLNEFVIINIEDVVDDSGSGTISGSL